MKTKKNEEPPRTENLYINNSVPNAMQKNPTQNKPKKRPKVLVGAPVYSNKKYVTPYWIQAVKNLSYYPYEIIVVDNSKPNQRFEKLFSDQGIKVITSPHLQNPFERLTEARRRLNEYAINQGFDYLMSIEQDVIVPPNIIDVLIAHSAPVVGAPYIVGSHR